MDNILEDFDATLGGLIPASFVVSAWSLFFTAILFVVAFALTKAFARHMSGTEQCVFIWLAWDAMIHFSVEGPFLYFSTMRTDIATSKNPLAVIWQEYGRADIRWIQSDPTIVSLEILTVLGAGPICLLIMYGMVKNRPWRHFWQIVLCVGELYGGFMTFSPEWLTGSKGLTTDDPLLLWVYLVFFNMLWVVIPLALLKQSYVYLCGALRESQQVRKTK